MPEGDTIHRAVARLRPILEDQRLERIELPRHTGALPEVGEIVDGVRAHGKHVVISFSGGLSLRCHLRMSGSWHAYRRGERWRRPRTQARIILGTEAWTVVCFNAPDVSVGPDVEADIEHLGPDLCVAGVDGAAAAARFDRFVEPDVPIGVALLDQRVAAGIGNVYKCEVLHIRGIDPRRPLADVELAEREAILELAADLLQANLAGGARRTVPEGLAVYGREGEPCRRCGGRIERIRQGASLPRSTWWCPGCQR